jgi:GNAT superfamily N-acetyltransferase
MADILITSMIHGQNNFYNTIGMVSLDKQIRKELGNPIDSLQGQIWYIAKIDDRLVGFVTIKIRSKYILLCHGYVFPQFRRQGIFNELVKYMLVYCKNIYPEYKIKSVVTKMALNTYIHYGFKIVKQTKNYSFIEL